MTVAFDTQPTYRPDPLQPRRDTLRLLGLRAWLKSNPDKHDQTQWALAPDEEFERSHRGQDVRFSCGTKACAAGWVSLLAGDVLDTTGRARDSFGTGDTVYYRAGAVITPEGREVYIGRRAAELLGLTDYMASILFHQSNKAQDLLKALKWLASGRPDGEVIEMLELSSSINLRDAPRLDG